MDLAFRDPELKALLQGAEGVFSSHVPVRLSCLPDKTYAECARSAFEALQETRQHRSFSRDIVLRYPHLRSLHGVSQCGGLRVVLEVVESWNDHVPLERSTLTVVFSTTGHLARWHFDENLLTVEHVRLMQDQFVAFLEAIARQPGQAIHTLDILGSEERTKLLIDWNATGTSYPADKCIHHLIEAQVARTPESVALAFEDRLLTYRELDSRANKLAQYLRLKGLQPDGLVGIYLERSLDMVVAVLATLKAGGAYLPLDPQFPRDRIRFMLDDAGASIIVTTGDRPDLSDSDLRQIVRLDSDAEAISLQPDASPVDWGRSFEPGLPDLHLRFDG